MLCSCIYIYIYIYTYLSILCVCVCLCAWLVCFVVCLCWLCVLCAVCAVLLCVLQVVLRLLAGSCLSSDASPQQRAARSEHVSSSSISVVCAFSFAGTGLPTSSERCAPCEHVSCCCLVVALTPHTHALSMGAAFPPHVHLPLHRPTPPLRRLLLYRIARCGLACCCMSCLSSSCSSPPSCCTLLPSLRLCLCLPLSLSLSLSLSMSPLTSSLDVNRHTMKVTHTHTHTGNTQQQQAQTAAHSASDNNTRRHGSSKHG